MKFTRRTWLVSALMASGVTITGAFVPRPTRRLVDPWSPPDFSAVPVADHRGKQRIAFVFFGDHGSGDANQYRVGAAMARLAKERSCDFALMLGDNMYTKVNEPTDPPFEERFEKPYAEFRKLGRFDVWGILGNHDNNGDWRAQILRTSHSDLWRMPALNYPVPNLPPWLHIHGVYTDPIAHGSRLAPSQEGEEMLSAASAYFHRQPLDGWRLVFGHHPAWAGLGVKTGVVRRSLVPFLRDVGAHAYFCGHAHVQQHISAPGFEQFIQGAGGDIRPDTERNVRGAMSRFFALEHGFGFAELTPDRMSISYHNADGGQIHAWRSERWNPRVPRDLV